MQVSSFVHRFDILTRYGHFARECREEENRSSLLCFVMFYNALFWTSGLGMEMFAGATSATSPGTLQKIAARRMSAMFAIRYSILAPKQSIQMSPKKCNQNAVKNNEMQLIAEGYYKVFRWLSLWSMLDFGLGFWLLNSTLPGAYVDPSSIGD